MRHRMAQRKLGRVTPHRIALLRNLATALFERERIQTTLAKAKELRPFAERLITVSRRDGDPLHARRLVLRDIKDAIVVRKLFDTIGARYMDRPGGYTRIVKLGARRSDGAEMAIIELVGSEVKGEEDAAKAKDKSAKKQAPSRKARAEKAEKKQKARKTPSKDAAGSPGAKAAPAKKGAGAKKTTASRKQGKS